MDIIENLGNSVIQHGQHNDRIYLMKMGDENPRETLQCLEELAKENEYSKIFAKVPDQVVEDFQSAGFISEAKVPNLGENNEEIHFMGKFLDEKRFEVVQESLLNKNLEIALKKADDPFNKSLMAKFECQACGVEDIEEMAEVYAQVFETYPFPIHETDFLKESMEGDTRFFGIRNAKNELVAVSSAEMDPSSRSAEMTDFATLPDYRGFSLASHLLSEMEQNIVDEGIETGFTIARAASIGMNVTFAKGGYEYSGRLRNNTNISGDIESMNVWYKKLVA